MDQHPCGTLSTPWTVYVLMHWGCSEDKGGCYSILGRCSWCFVHSVYQIKMVWWSVFSISLGGLFYITKQILFNDEQAMNQLLVFINLSFNTRFIILVIDDECVLITMLKLIDLAGSLVVKSVGPVTERLLVWIPSWLGEKSVIVPLSKVINSYLSHKLLWIRASANWQDCYEK